MTLPFRSSPLRRWFERNDGHLIDTWLHYFDICDRHFAPFRRTEVGLLEIDVSHGGSLDTLYDHPAEGFVDLAHRAQLASLNRPSARLRRAVRDPRRTLARIRPASPVDGGRLRRDWHCISRTHYHRAPGERTRWGS